MLSQGVVQQQRQSPRLIPQQITYNTVLEMNLAQLQQHVRAESEDNPALSVVELPSCPYCGAPMETRVCWECGSSPSASQLPRPDPLDDAVFSGPRPVRNPDLEDWDPLSVVATSWELRDDLKVQLGMVLEGDDLAVGEFLIECLNDDGYFTEDLFEIAERFQRSVPEVEAVLKAVQSLDPAGVGARTVEECLRLQLDRLGDDPEVALMRRIVDGALRQFAARRFDRVAKSLGVSQEEVQRAWDYTQANLAPRPGRSFRVSWQGLSPSRNRQLGPDVILRFEGDKLVAEAVEFRSWRVQLEAQYERLDRAMRQHRSAFSAADRQHVRLYVGRARALAEALVQRRRTLERVSLFIGEAQREFLLRGPEFLKPLTKKQVAQAMELHESTVCRATLHKHVQLPSGEVTPFDTFFDGSLSPKEFIRRIIAQEPPGTPLSDGEIARRMADFGFQLARRTIAKYRDALGVPPVEMRRRA